jgi:hypothetical protein
LPAGTCSLTKPTIFFAMVFYSLRVTTLRLNGLGSPGLTTLLLKACAESVRASHQIC